MMFSTRRRETTTDFDTLSWIERFSRRQQFRRTANALLSEPYDALADMGYERKEVMKALKLPLRDNAARYLENNRKGPLQP
ncbi:MAG: hypothetical protein ACTHYN_09660 [Marinobacter sp.]|uniref:hypothetical protein n=1 Tax=Marinobacter sp. TaxID=50741 RepID=UPI003F9DAB96